MPKILTSDMFHDCPQLWDIICRVGQSPVGQAMKQTVEDSPYHREENTWVHTEMVIDQYMQRFYPIRSESQNKIALLALAFHDAGKPDAEETLEKKDGSGTYRRYAGHEQLSAVAFTEHWLTDPVLQDLVSVEEARQVRFIIEHHLPYGLKDGKKRSDLRTAIEHTLREDVETFYDCLRSDAAGRISDDHATKLANVEAWIAEFRTVPLTINKHSAHMGKCFIMVGPSGSGKSTWVKQYLRACDKVVSLDQYRLHFWRDSQGPSGLQRTDARSEYELAWGHSAQNEAEFKKYVDYQLKCAFKSLAITRGDVYVDNTNGSKKARARWIQEARNIGMKVVAVEFWNTLPTLVERQFTRPDKSVPTNSVAQQYVAQTCALKGSEVDEVIVVPGT